jgi:hypothetical protein
MAILGKKEKICKAFEYDTGGKICLYPGEKGGDTRSFY